MQIAIRNEEDGQEWIEAPANASVDPCNRSDLYKYTGHDENARWVYDCDESWLRAFTTSFEKNSPVLMLKTPAKPK